MKKNILIVDDYDNTLFLTGFTIRQAGYNVITAASAKDALRLLSYDSTIDLVITDYNMDEMDGTELTHQIRSLDRYSKTPIFMMTTEGKTEIREAAMKAGVSKWIVKPFVIDKLLSSISEAILQE